jgi:hypothetical protein
VSPTLDEQIRRLEASFRQAASYDLAVTATREYGAAKQRALALFEAPALKDLFPSRWLGSDEHAPTEDLIAALNAAKARLDRNQATAARDLGEVKTLLLRARAVQGAGKDKRETKRRALELLSSRYPSVFEQHVSFLRRQFRTEHTPSAELVEALAQAKRENQLQGASDDRLDALSRELRPFVEKRALKQEINALLARGETDLRPRTSLRVDHAPMADLVELLQKLEKGYQDEADPTRRAERRQELEDLVTTLDRRKTMKADRDRLVAEAKQVKAALKASRTELARFVEALTAQTAEYEKELAEAQAQVDLAARAAWNARLARESAQREHQVVEECIDRCGQDLLFDPKAGATFEGHLTTLAGGRLAADETVSRTAAAEARAAADFSEALFRKQQPPEPELGRLEEALRVGQEAHRSARVEASSAALAGELLRRYGSPGNESLDQAIAVIRDELSGKLPALEEETRRRETAATQAAEASRQAQDARAQIEIAFQTAVRDHGYYLGELQGIEKALEDYARLKREYRANRTLVYYIGAGDNVYRHLLGVAHLLRGRRDTVDSMGHVRVSFVIDGGVRAGADFGFVGLSAKVGAALLLEGELGVVDSREVMFQSHLRVAFFAEATAKLGVSQSDLQAAVDALPVGGALTVPDLLVKASARCEAPVHDVRTCTLFDDERHWAAHWADAIAKRLAFLQAVNLAGGGFGELNEAWLDRKVIELAGSGEKLLDFVGELALAARKPPRVIDVELTDGFQATGAASVGSLSTKAGTDLQAASLRIRPRWAPDRAWTVQEHAVSFVPRGEETEAPPPVGVPAAQTAFEGTSIHHCLEAPGTRPPGASGPRSYLEVTLVHAHAISVGGFKLSSAATLEPRPASDAAAQQRYARLARALEVTPNPDFKRLIRLPEALKSSFADEEAWRRFARTVRLRLDIVAAGGEPARLTKLLNELSDFEVEVEQRLAAAKEKADHIGALAREFDQALADRADALERQSLVEASAFAGLHGQLSSLSERVASSSATAGALAEELKEALHERVTALKENVTLLNNSHAVYTRWIQSWVCAAPGKTGATLRWSKRWVPQLHRGICRRQFSFSAEGSIPILPALAIFLGVSLQFETRSSEFEVLGLDTFSYLKGLAGAMSEERWRRWWALHQGELEALCQQVSVPGSVAFSEVACDALFATGPLREKARRFGESCWGAHRHDENPFTGRGPRLEERLCRALRGGPGLPHNPLLAGPLHGGALILNPLYLERLRESLQRSFLGRSLAPLGGSLRASLERLTRKLGAIAHHKEHELRGSLETGFERSPEGERRRIAAFEELIGRREACEEAVQLQARTLPPVGTTRESLRVRGERLRELLAAELTGLLALEAGLRAELAEDRTPSLTLRQLVPEREDPPFDLQVLEEAARATLTSAVRRDTAVTPLSSWAPGSQIRFMFRSDETKALDLAVSRYHDRVAIAGYVDEELGVSRDTVSVVKRADAAALGERLSAALELLAAIDRWRGARDLSNSKRFPKVAVLLLLPTVEECRRLTTALLAAYVRLELADRARQARELDAALAEARGRHLLVKVRLRGAVARTTRQGKLWHELLDYLQAGAADFEFDALVHGKKQVILQGPSEDPRTVAEPVHKKTGS